MLLTYCCHLVGMAASVRWQAVSAEHAADANRAHAATRCLPHGRVPLRHQRHCCGTARASSPSCWGFARLMHCFMGQHQARISPVGHMKAYDLSANGVTAVTLKVDPDVRFVVTVTVTSGARIHGIRYGGRHDPEQVVRRARLRACDAPQNRDHQPQRRAGPRRDVRAGPAAAATSTRHG